MILPSSNGFDSGVPGSRDASCVQRPHNVSVRTELPTDCLPTISREKAPLADFSSRKRRLNNGLSPSAARYGRCLILCKASLVRRVPLDAEAGGDCRAAVYAS